MVNFNGNLKDNAELISIENRGYKYGDGLFETLKVVNKTILFWEAHYFRLMASMRILRMEIPMTFTMEFLGAEILKTIEKVSSNSNVFRVRLNVDRGNYGTYLPTGDSINYGIVAEPLESLTYEISNITYRADLFKDHYVNTGLLTNLKSNNKIINVLANIYAKENDLANCILLNNNKNLAEASNGNLFLVQGNSIKTPLLQDGALKGIMRSQVIDIVKSLADYSIEETTISPFEIQKSDEVFITNVITGIQPITHYRKKEFGNAVATLLIDRLNEKVEKLISN